eukprot:15365132-Ditylum_brightwellii.AAC.1
MDANGGIGNAKLRRFLNSTRLVDSIGATHGMNSPPTYIGGILLDLQIHQACRVETKQPSRIETSQERATANISTCELTKQLSVLEEDYNNTGILKKEQYEMIGQDLHQSVMDAETSLPKVLKAWWTPEIGHKFRLLQYWRAKLSFVCNKMEETTELGLLRKQLPDDIEIFQGDEKRRIRAQQDHLEKKALLAVHEEDPSVRNLKVAKIVKQMKNKEQSCKMYQVFKTYLKAAQKAALSHVDVPDFSEMWLALFAMMGIICSTRGKWGWILVFTITAWIHALFNYHKLFATNVPHKRVVEHDKMHKCLHHKHRTHFGQAQRSPATEQPISTLFGKDTDSQFSEVF